MQHKLSLFQGLGWILLSVVFVSGPCFGGFYLYKKFQYTRKSHPEYRLKTIITSTKIHPDFFCEILNLDRTKKISLYSFDLEEAKQALLDHPVIQDVFIKRHPPSSIYIDCEFRLPAAILLDYENTLIDEEGYVFPHRPFYKMKNLPEIYLGLSSFGIEGGAQYNVMLESKKWKAALELLKILSVEPFKDRFFIERIDVSNLEAKSYGRKEIVLFLKEKMCFEQFGKKTIGIFPMTLRFHPKTYRQQLRNFLALRSEMKKDYQKQLVQMHIKKNEISFDRKVFDFRISKLAFIDP